MNQILDIQNGYLIISDKYNVNSPSYSVDYAPHFYNINDQYTLSFINIQNVENIVSITYSTINSTDNRYLKTYYRISRDNISWTPWMEMKSIVDNFPPFDPKDLLFLDVKWVREGFNNTGFVRLLDYEIKINITRNISDDGGVVNLNTNDNVIIKPPYIYKVFKINDVEIILNKGNISDLEIMYRFSQDNSRTWSRWEYLTKENIKTVRINPIRFFQIEYLVTNKSNNNVIIQDIRLIGDFQNVSLDYFKTNLYGIRECCPSNNNNMMNDLNSDTCEINLPTLSDEEKNKLFNPYEQNAALNLLNKLSNDALNIFGHPVKYFVTDPDKKGQDHTLNEYQLYNVVCSADLKVSVVDNNFPDNQIVINQFDLNLFETMEVHITKEEFKKAFGPHRRPSKEDFLYFCNLNRMFQVEHAQQFRSFNNSSVYYKLILKKYTQKSNVKADNIEIKNELDMLTRNSTIEQLFGIEIEQDKKAVANKDQFKPLTKDPIRLEYKVKINKELIENSTNIISKSNYELSTIGKGLDAVIYKNLYNVIKKSDNIGYIIWFNIHNYVINENYNFYKYYDDTNNLGWRVDLMNDTINVKLNSDVYSFNLTGTSSSIPNTIMLNEDTWYCYVLNIDQRNKKMEQWIYKRNVDEEENASYLNSTILKELYNHECDINPIEFELSTNINASILGSDMKVTNIRLFSDIIPKETHNKILNQYIIRDDSKFLIFADNANTRLYLPNFPLGNE